MKNYSRVYTKRFRKDLKRLEKSGYDLKKLGKVIDRLAAGEELEKKYLDHALKGELSGIRECHLSSDWLLQYTKDDLGLILLLMRTGTHRNVLGIE